MDFEVQHCTRRCHHTERELAPGESFYSVLVADGADVVRRDYGEDVWAGPPTGSVGWWKSRMPGANPNKIHWAPSDVMLDYFEQTENVPDKQDIRYVLALLLMRRRIVRLEDSDLDDDGGEYVVLYCPRREKTYRARTTSPQQDRVKDIQEELAQLLFANAD